MAVLEPLGSLGASEGLPTRSRAYALASQLSFLGCQVVFVAAIRFTVGRTDRFVGDWATEALNLQLLWVVPWLALLGIAGGTGVDAVYWLAVVYFEIVGGYTIVVGIVGAVKAWRGQVWRYPVNLRLVGPPRSR